MLGIMPEDCAEEQSSSESIPKPETAAAGQLLAANLKWLPETFFSDEFHTQGSLLSAGLAGLTLSLRASARATAEPEPNEDLAWLRGNLPELASAASQLVEELGEQNRLPLVVSHGHFEPRVVAIARGFVDFSGPFFSKQDFTIFCQAFEAASPLNYHEVGLLPPAIRFSILEKVLAWGEKAMRKPMDVPHGLLRSWIQTFHYAARASWKDELESIIPFEAILCSDPAGAYARMDSESRSVYREKVAEIAKQSGRTEVKVAQEALALARDRTEKAPHSSRVALREGHVGYYLIGEGVSVLHRRIGFRPASGDRLRTLLGTHPDEVLLGGIGILTALICTVFVAVVTPESTPLSIVLLALLAVLIPASQAAVSLMNALITNLLRAHPLPKLDFSRGIPGDCVTLVAIPTLLLNEEQVRGLVEELEVRFSGNHDRNLHFAIVSDLPDAQRPASEDHDLVTLCSTLVHDLNAKYARKDAGTFFHLHRHRVYNPNEKGWMGWERKRGKLLDLNQLLRGGPDRFPVKTGSLAILPDVRFVITLDSDTKLPRGAAQRMIGALAHPLNQAILDPEHNVVIKGYGILQPRVGISSESSTISRLAALFAGETRFDPYTRAVSDVYQDLYREGIFAGKGIYEVDTVSQVLHGRFPRNLLLSHDLLEGAYARVGLVTDVVVIEDYPSHYSAYSRRKHRWVRGDWQIMEWLPDQVVDEDGSRVPNPISLVSRWKILDNIRRSLVDPATCALLLLGWLVMAKPVSWTIGTIIVLLLPALVEFVVRFAGAVFGGSFDNVRSALTNARRDVFGTFVGLVLLAHQALLSLDAIGRAMVRRWVTGQHLLEWQTAAQAEFGGSRTWIERSLGWLHFFALGMGAIIWWARPGAFWSAAPVLALWACSMPVVYWLDGCPVSSQSELARDDAHFLRNNALYIWRYFREFSNAEHNWLIPDNIQGVPIRVAARVSPTNVGLLLNARQAALEFGYLTLPEMAELTIDTFTSLGKLEKYRGHLFNWYDTRTLQPQPPRFVSSVDSGNLVASLWALEQGCLRQLRRPLLSRALAEGFLDYLHGLASYRALPNRLLHKAEVQLQGNRWLEFLLAYPEAVLINTPAQTKAAPDVAWLQQEALQRLSATRKLLEQYFPWRLTRFAQLNTKVFADINLSEPPLDQLPDFIAELQTRIQVFSHTSRNGDRPLALELAMLLWKAEQNARLLVEQLRDASRQAHELAETMSFAFLLNDQRMQLSVGFDATLGELQPYAYDLLASEARTAVFVAIAKDDIPEECWLRLGRPSGVTQGRQALLSWTGTMFEYAMPLLWMHTPPNTMLDQAIRAAVREQKIYAKNRGIPWGISECASAQQKDGGDYHYHAFGVPALAKKKCESEPSVVSPYSTFLALPVDREAALANLRRMKALGWFGSYGFREAADYSAAPRRSLFRRPALVHAWMAHHQGMSLLSIANVLLDNLFQQWFHADPRVQATELLLEERPISTPSSSLSRMPDAA
jgi:hypothetical protein